MEKKNLLVRIFVPVVVAGMVFVGLPACFQDDGYPEGFVLNYGEKKHAARRGKY